MLKLDDFLPYRLSVAANRVSEIIARAYREAFGLSIPEWRTLAVIAESDGITQQAVAARTCMDKLTVSRATIALARRGLVVRTSNPHDGRSRLLTLSEAGRVLHARVVPQARALESKVFNDFSSDDRSALFALLKRIDDAALGARD